MTVGLTEEQVVFVLTSPLPSTSIARQFGCTPQAICDIRNYKTHKRVRPDIPRTNRFSTRRLKPENIAYIRQSDESNASLARRFNVSRRTIISAKRGETYKDQDAPTSAAQSHCHNCKHWSAACDLGFPEAIEDPLFAAECSLYINSSL